MEIEKYSSHCLKKGFEQMVLDAESNTQNLLANPDESMGYVLALWYWQEQLKFAQDELQKLEAKQ